MDWKIRSPRQFAPLGNLSGLGVQIVSGGIFSNTSLLSAVYYYILHSQSAIASDGPRVKLGSQLVSSENCVRRQVVLSRTLLADSSALSSRAAMARVRLVLTSTDFLGTAVVQRCRWGLCEEFLVQLQFKWPLFTELVGFSFTEETCCSKLIHATIPRSLPLPQVFQAIQLEIYPRTKSGQQRIPGTKAYAHPCYL